MEAPLLQPPAVGLAAAVGRPDAYAGELPVAYVQLKSGATASPDEIKAFARAGISERGAAPSDVYIIDKLPLTEVGKIFKPPLRCEAAQRAFSVALAGLAAGVSASVEVNEVPGSGMRARVTLSSSTAGSDTAAEAKARQIMDAHTMAYDVVWNL